MCIYLYHFIQLRGCAHGDVYLYNYTDVVIATSIVADMDTLLVLDYPFLVKLCKYISPQEASPNLILQKVLTNQPKVGITLYHLPQHS